MKKISSILDVARGKAANKFFTELFEEIYLVGGTLRDELLDRASTDLDYATPLQASEIKGKLQTVGLPIRTEGERFGTVGTRLGVFDIQITSFREEIYPENSRHPSIRLLSDIDSDLSRRDFTINSMAVSSDEFIDPYDGYSDIANKIIRAVGEADVRMKEDPLRILRAYRFVSQLGFEISDKTLEAIYENASLISKLPGARVGGELGKILEGDYWSDALIEMAESGALSGLTSQFAKAGEILPRFVQEELDQYSLKELADFDISYRWGVFFSIVNQSKLGQSASTGVDDKFITELGNWFELGKSLIHDIEQVLKTLHDENRVFSKTEERINRFKQEVNLYEYDLNHPRYNFAKSGLDFELARIEFRKANFSSAILLARSSIENIDKNFKYTIGTTSEELLAYKAARYRVPFFERFKYLIAGIMIVDSVLDKTSDLDKIEVIVLRKIRVKTQFNFSKTDWSAIVEESVVLVFKSTGRTYKMGDLDSFLKNKAEHISDEKKYHLRKNNLQEVIHYSGSSPEQKRDTYKKIIDLVEEYKEDRATDEYLDLELNYNIWNCLSTSDIGDFWSKYDLLELSASKVMDLGRYDSIKKSYLASASVLVHGLSMDTSVEEKADISLMIVSHYLMSRTSAGARNAKRFRIYRDWFKILIAVKNITDIKRELPEAVYRLREVKSFGYIDEDENYFNSHLKELSATRNNVNNVIEFLNYIVGNIRSFKRDIDSPLSNISSLLDEHLISYDDGFKVFQNWCTLQSASNIDDIAFKNIEQVYPTSISLREEKSANVVLIEKGEDDHTEFKASFRYNIQTKMLDKIEGIPYSSIKTIAAFLNTSGGKLFIGVSDKPELTGLEASDFKVLRAEDSVQKKVDIVKLQIDEMIDKNIGSHYVGNIVIDWEQYEGKTFLIVNVSPASQAVFCNQKFYIRNSSGCRELQAQDMLQYIGTHFSTAVVV